MFNYFARKTFDLFALFPPNLFFAI